jgi:hypothetical protein
VPLFVLPEGAPGSAQIASSSESDDNKCLVIMNLRAGPPLPIGIVQFCLMDGPEDLIGTVSFDVPI